MSIKSKITLGEGCKRRSYSPAQNSNGLQPNSQQEKEICSSNRRCNDSWAFKATPDELAVTVLLRVFDMATPVLGVYVIQRMKRHFGERQWFDEILQNVRGSRMRPRLEKNPNVLQHDIHLVTQIFLNELETVLSGASVVDVDKVKLRGILLQRVAVEVDCIGETRNALHHGIPLSASEVLRCLQSLESLWCRMEPEELPRHAIDNLQENIQASVYMG